MGNQSLISALNLAEQKNSSNIAIVDSARDWTFTELKGASDSLAISLVKKGIKKGDRIALYCINSAEFAISYMGILKAGAVIVPINLLQKPTEIEFVLNDAGVSGLIYHQLFQANVEQFKPAITSLIFDISIANDLAESPFESLITARDGVTLTLSIDPDEDLAAILYTSGTTGRPKGAMLTHTNLLSNTTSVFQAMQWQSGKDRIVLVLPMFHAFAATVGMLTPLIHGCSFVPVAKFEPDALLKTIDDTQATIFLGVPSMYNVLLNTKSENIERFKSIASCISGGASMPVDVLTGFENKFKTHIYEGDGPTECSPVTCVNPIGGLQKIGTVGLPVPNVEMCIFDEKGQELPNGEIGEIAVRAPSVMKGYWNLPEATFESFIGEWFLTGDLGTKDNDGYFSILDRKKDMVIVNGMNVYPRIIEEILYQHEAVLEAAVIGEQNDLHGEIPVAYVVIKEGLLADQADIRGWCRRHLGGYEVPRKVVFLDALPKNAAGKIVKRTLRKQGEIERGIT